MENLRGLPVASAGPATVRIRLLGAFEVELNGRIVPLRSSAQQAVVALLAMRANTVVSTQWLIDQVWHAMPAASARNNLHVQLSQLRKTLTAAGGQDLIHTERGGYRLTIDPDAIDTVQFERLLSRAQQLAAANQPAAVAPTIREAFRLWRGEPFRGIPAAAEFDCEARRLESLHADAAEVLFEAELALGPGAHVVAELERCVGRHPMRERLWVQLISALARVGRQQEAVAAYHRLTATLRTRAAVEPSEATRRLIAAVQSGTFGMAPPTVGPSPTNLPLSPDELVGRTAEVAAVAGLLSVDHTGVPMSRAVTLTGPGGIGKTRLAVAVAQHLVPHFEQGAVFVALTSVDTARGLLLAVSQALGLGNRPVASAQELAGLLRNRPILVVLDNAEQITDLVADLLARTLAAGPGPAFLVTSRIRLRLSGGTEYPVAPLPVRAEACGRSVAAQLFDARSARFVGIHRWGPDERAAVEQVCAVLGGLPLAIELAAGMTRLLSPSQILGHLASDGRLVSSNHDVPARHRSLEETLRWGYDLLDPESRELFTALAVFAGSFDLQAVCRVCELDTSSAVTRIGELVDHSVLRTEPGTTARRYRVLTLLRQFGAGQRDPSLTATLRRRHAEHFADRVSSALVELTPGEDPLRNLRIEGDLENHRAAMAFAQEVGDVELAAALAIGLQSYFFDAAKVAEGREWFDWVLGRREQLPALLRCILMIRAADIYDVTTEQGFGWVSVARDELRDLEEPLWLARAETTLGWAYMMRDDPVTADRTMRSALAAARAGGDTTLERRLLGSLAAVAEDRGDLAGAAQEYEQVLALHRADEELVDIAVQAGNLSVVRTAQGRYEDAVALADESRRAAEISHTLPYLVYAHAAAALAHAHSGRWEQCRDELTGAGAAMETDAAELGAAEHFAFQALARLLAAGEDEVAAATALGILERDAARMGQLARGLTSAIEAQTRAAQSTRREQSRAAGRTMTAALAIAFLRRSVGCADQGREPTEFSLNAH